MQQPVTSPPLFNSDEFKKKTDALKEALQDLSNQTKKPSFLVLEPDIVPDALINWDPKVETVSVLDVLSFELNVIKQHSTRWKNTYFIKQGLGFHSVEFKNRFQGKQYMVSTSTEYSEKINSAADAAQYIIRKHSQEHQDLLCLYYKRLRQTISNAITPVHPPVLVTPTHSDKAPQTFFDQSPLPINALSRAAVNNQVGLMTGATEVEIEANDEVPMHIPTTNCTTPTSSDNHNNQQCGAPEGFFSSFNDPNLEEDAKCKVVEALKTLCHHYGGSRTNAPPKHIQAFACDVMMNCGNNDLQNNIYTIKQCQGNRVRFDNRNFQFIPTPKGKASHKQSINSKANAIQAQLELSIPRNDQHQLREIVERLQRQLGLNSKKAERSTQTDHPDLPMPAPTSATATAPTRRRKPQKKYWTSKNAFNLFGRSKEEEEQEANADAEDFGAQEFDHDSVEVFFDMKHIVRKRVDRLRLAFTTADGHRKVLSEKWRKAPVSESNRFQIVQRSRYLVAALEIALLKMPDFNWETCCQKAVEQVNASEGAEFIKSGRTVRKWQSDFVGDGCTFDGLVNRVGATRMPKFFEDYPEQKTLITKYAMENLNILTMEMMHDFIHKTLLPNLKEQMVSELREELNAMESEEGRGEIEERIESITVDSILKESHLSVLNAETIRRWMHKLGFTYEDRKKCFFVDVHERDDVVEDRNVFVKDYLRKDLRRHCWVQKQADDVELLELYETGQLKRDQGHRFEKDGEEWIEFHVDDHKSFFEWANENCMYGGNLSARFPEGEKYLASFGQDEVVFKQFLTTPKAWKGPKGETALVPKDDGCGWMISGYNSRELGFGIEWTDELRDRVNAARSGRMYIDEEAALEVHSTRMKYPLEDNPLVRFFEYGAANEGYWNSHHMLCQVEDVADVLKLVFHSDQWDIELIVDHSQGHDRLRPDGLTVTKMNLLFGGLQAMMRDSQLTSPDDFGSHPRSLEDFYTQDCKYFRKKNQTYKQFIPTDPTAAAKQFNINDTQSMVFTQDDVGPFYLTNAERDAYRTDTVIGDGMKNKTADDLRRELNELFESEGISCNVCLKGANKKKLVELAELHCVDLKKPYIKIRQGWVGAAKGKLQVAFERGLIDPTKSYDYYSEKGRKDEVVDTIIEGTSIDQLIQSLRDFREEKTLLQVRAEEMGISIVRSPKCHPEIAGKGIEYVWGVAKMKFRREPLEKKRGKDNFHNVVRDCLSTNHITKAVARGCAARARAFMLAYQARYLLSLDTSEHIVEELRNNPMCHDLLEKCVKKFRSHRSAIDFDNGFVNKMVQISTNVDADN